MRTMHLFAGAGGGLLADKILGHTPIIAIEWDRYACAVLRERAADGWFPELRVWEGDVRAFDASEYAGVVDCIHAGFPCQDISSAGKQAGLGEGTRSGLYREVVRIASDIRPRYLFLENVAAILSQGVGTVYADLASLGYEFRSICVRASDVGANHHRDRWWCLAKYCDRDVCNPNHDGQPAAKIRESLATRGYRNTQRSQQACESSGSGCEHEILAHANGFSQQGQFRESANAQRWTQQDRGSSGSCSTGGKWWEAEPRLDRVADGVAHRVDRLKAIGNGQVPLQAAVAFKILESMY